MTLQEIDALEDEIFGDARFVWTNTGLQVPITARRAGEKTAAAIERGVVRMRHKAARLIGSVFGDLAQTRPR